MRGKSESKSSTMEKTTTRKKKERKMERKVYNAILYHVVSLCIIETIQSDISDETVRQRNNVRFAFFSRSVVKLDHRYTNYFEFEFRHSSKVGAAASSLSVRAPPKSSPLPNKHRIEWRGTAIIVTQAIFFDPSLGVHLNQGRHDAQANIGERSFSVFFSFHQEVLQCILCALRECGGVWEHFLATQIEWRAGERSCSGGMNQTSGIQVITFLCEHYQFSSHHPQGAFSFDIVLVACQAHGEDVQIVISFRLFQRIRIVKQRR